MDEVVERCGKIQSYNEGSTSVVVQSLPAEPGMATSALDHDSVVCTENRDLVGRVEEVFGPVKCPYYLIRLMGDFVPATKQKQPQYKEAKQPPPNRRPQGATQRKGGQN